MKRTATVGNRSLRRRALRAAMFLFTMAAMLKALAVPVMAAPAFWSVKIARPTVFCQRGIGICIDLFGSDGTAATPVAVEEYRRGIVSYTEPRMLGMRFLAPLNEQGDTFHIDEDVTLDRRHSLELGYQQVTLLKGAYPITRTPNSPNGEVLIAMRTIGITITFDIGRKSMGCTGAGVCKVTVGFELGRMKAPGSATLDGNRLGYDFLLELEDVPDSGMLYVDEDIELDEQTSLALGAKKVVILEGAYEIDRSENPNGHVDFNVLRIGITVTVDIGRKAHGCTRFGACSITVGVDLRAANPSPGILSLDGRHVTIDFTERLKNAEDHFVLDADLELDAQTSLALGRRGVVLKAGRYPLDTTRNPNGSVTIPVSARGIVVTIRFGVPSRNCTGVGFCSITIGFDRFMERALGGVAEVIGEKGQERLVVELAGRAPEQGDELVIENDMTLDSAVATALGYKNIVLKRGVYRIDYSTNPNGTVEIPVSALRPIEIRIKIGRASYLCIRIGVCGIEVWRETTTMERSVQAFVTNAHGDLLVEFRSMLPEEGDTLFVDEDVYLPAETARELGVENIYLKRGAYPIDRSQSANGTVRVATGSDGTATVESDEAIESTLSVFPNPATTSATASFTTNGTGVVSLELLDARGTVVMSVVDGERLERGTHVRTMDLSSLPAGAYFQRLTVGTTSTLSPVQITR
jgi:hypothetical protein